MFLIRDTLDARQTQIRGFLRSEPAIAVILAAADFEWTVRRTILALGRSSTTSIRRRFEKERVSGLGAYKELWKEEVKNRLGTDLAIVVPNWQFFSETAFQLRHRLVHGVSGTTGVAFAERSTESILAATKAVAQYAEFQGEPIYGRQIRRLNPR